MSEAISEAITGNLCGLLFGIPILLIVFSYPVVQYFMNRNKPKDTEDDETCTWWKKYSRFIECPYCEGIVDMLLEETNFPECSYEKDFYKSTAYCDECEKEFVVRRYWVYTTEKK